MKMILLPSSILVLLYATKSTSLVSAQSSSSGAYTLSNDITAFIPSCAQTCFSSFVEANFPISVCSSTPSLECLCSSKSTSGYTVGEGALQCIISEDSLGFCQGLNATAAAVNDAFNMCSGTANALPNTHATITATLEVQTSAPSIVLVVTAPTSGNSPVSATAIASAPSKSSFAATTVSQTASNSLSVTSAPTAEGQAAGSSEKTAKLTTPQIVGIAVGSGIVAILVIGGILTFGCLRRRKILHDDDDDSVFGNFQEEHGNSMEGMFAGPMEKKQGNFAAGGTKTGIAARMPPPIPPPPVMTGPNMFSRRSVRTEEIGVAISPEMARENEEAFEGRHPSRLLPEKPALPKFRTEVPQQQKLWPWHPDDPVPLARNRQDLSEDQRRDSAATQFDVDLVSPVEFSRNPTNFDYGYAYPYEHGGPQLPQNWHQADLPRSRTAPIQMAPRPLDIRKSQSHQSFSQPLRPRSGTSSVYTGAVSLAPSDGGVTPKEWQRPTSYMPFNPYEMKGQDSFGSQNTVGSTPNAKISLPELRTVDLSPVAESPTNGSPVGRSPVQYPVIKSRLSDQMMKGMDSRQQLVSEGKRRKKDGREPISPPPFYNKMGNINIANSAKPIHEAPPANDSRSHIAARRNKLGPALQLGGELKKKKEEWRVVPIEEELKSPTGGPTLTPRRIGDDLFIGVQEY